MDYSLLIGVKKERFTVLDSKTRPSLAGAALQTKAKGQQQEQTERSSEAEANRIAAVAAAAMSPRASDPRDPFESHASWRIFGGDAVHDQFQRDADGGMRARIVEGPGTYYIGIIDILQEWNYAKRLERFFKVYCKFLDADGLSAISPGPYAERFWRRCVVDTFEGIQFDDSYLEADGQQMSLTEPSSSSSGGGGSSSLCAAERGLQGSSMSQLSDVASYGESGQFVVSTERDDD